ncbi:MAG: transcription initiation factor IIB [Nitrososphaeraceae archaeon]
MSYQYHLQEGYQQKNKLADKGIKANYSSNVLCHSCDSIWMIYDGSTGETICTKCGTVLTERPTTIETGPSSIESFSNSVSLAFPDKGLSTVITSANIDASGSTLNHDQIQNVNKLRYLDKVSNNNRTQIRNLKNAFVTMAAIRDKLTLTDPVMERAAYYYRKTLHNKLIKGRSIREMVVASIYVSCKEMEVPRTLCEICDAANADPIFAGKCYRTMARELRISPLIVDSARYISKVADSASVSQKTYRRAVEMLDIVKKHAISYGKDPKALATAVLYAACIKENEPSVSQAKIAAAGSISVVTLRKRFSDILRLIPRDNINKNYA